MLSKPFCLKPLALILLLSPLGLWAQTGTEVLEKFIAAAGRIQTLSYTQKKDERIDGKIIKEKMHVRMARGPFKLYQKFDYPRTGYEVLYLTGGNSGKAWVSPGKILPTLSLDPYGGLMRENQHHTIFEVGYDHLVAILKHLKTVYGPNSDKMVRNEGVYTWNNIKCWKVTLGNPNFGWKPYTVQAGENLITIARKFFLSEHMILEKNKLRAYDGLKAGQVIQIPTDYSKTATFYIDMVTHLPVLFENWDDLGLYEHYEFYDVKVNPVFPANTFDKTNPDYGF
jgi:LysM repeat protein